jgi:tRNA threonylcarbamoyladenosine biosynthesis protein TsaB
MKILAIDTTTKYLCLGLYDDGKIYECNLETGRLLSGLIAVMIKRALSALNWQASDIDYFACGIGPGSFTGTRVGVATVKGMSWALRKPVIGISTLDILARNSEGNNYIYPIIDAKRSLIYAGAFKDGGLKKVRPYMLLNESELIDMIKPGSLVLGDACAFYGEKIIKNIPGVRVLDRDYWYPKARNIIQISLERIKQDKLSNAFDIEPIYLYPKECQVKAATSRQHTGRTK